MPIDYIVHYVGSNENKTIGASSAKEAAELYIRLEGIPQNGLVVVSEPRGNNITFSLKDGVLSDINNINQHAATLNYGNSRKPSGIKNNFPALSFLAGFCKVIGIISCAISFLSLCVLLIMILLIMLSNRGDSNLVPTIIVFACSLIGGLSCIAYSEAMRLFISLEASVRSIEANVLRNNLE